MAGPYSIHSVEQSEPPKWKPGEEPAAAAFVAMTFLLVLEVNFEIFRIFRRRKGLYFWAMTLGTWAIGLDAVGMSLKYLAATKRVWVLYTIFMSIGWAGYTIAQMVVLLSRLHLVNDSAIAHRAVLVMISVLSPIIIVADWVTTWGSYNPDRRMSSAWWPRHAIIERFVPVAFTVMEVVISAIYIQSLMGLLHMRSSVRTRRVMLDLVYVLILVVSLDVVNVVLTFLNQIGLSHPIQTFSYILKLRMEFLVLNQLMAVAARGLKRETFGEKRYHDPQALRNFSTFGADIQNVGTTNIETTDDRIPFRRDSTITALPAISPQSTNRQPSFPEATFDAAIKDASELEKATTGGARGSWFSITYNHLRHKESGEERILPHARRLKNRTIWRNEDDDEDEGDLVGFDEWERCGSTKLRVPWFRTSQGEYVHDVK
ncbi:MAG: hypothetical protein Q9219_006034 [cf. Caloplaca sp. 3 TL-2023]